mgnify:CR=1 FL=1
MTASHQKNSSSIYITTREIELTTKGHTHIIDITQQIRKIIKEEGFTEGNVLLFATGSTCSLTTIEYEEGLVQTDFPQLMEEIAPYEYPYAHHKRWGDDNGAAHIRASLMGPSIIIPFFNGELLCGTWQQIVFIDFDTRPRKRKIICQITGKKQHLKPD